MIFFLTTVIPASHMEAAVEKYKTDLFHRGLLVPTPILLLPVALSSTPPARQSRKEISAAYPEVLTPGAPYIRGDRLLIPFDEPLPFICERGLESVEPLIPGQLFLGRILISDPDPAAFPGPGLKSFRNYSVRTYRIETSGPQSFWENMSWERVLDIRKGK